MRRACQALGGRFESSVLQKEDGWVKCLEESRIYLVMHAGFGVMALSCNPMDTFSFSSDHSAIFAAELEL
jgi:hypothetical protein